MQRCWKLNPLERPKFSELSNIFAKFMEIDTKNSHELLEVNHRHFTSIEYEVVL